MIFYILGSLSFLSTVVGQLAAKFSALQKSKSDLEAEAVEETYETTCFSYKHGCEIINAVFILFMVTLIPTLWLHFYEDVDFLSAVYWSVVTCSTVGYGDITVKKTQTRIFLIFYIFVGVLMYGWALGKFAKVFMNIEQEKQMAGFVDTGVTMKMIAEMDQPTVRYEDGERVVVQEADGEVDRIEFLEYMLVSLNKCSKSDIRKILKMFDDLDRTNDGTINANDVQRYIRETPKNNVASTQGGLSSLRSFSFPSFRRSASGSTDDGADHYQPRSPGPA